MLDAIAKPGEYRSLALSPDGKRVAFESVPPASSDIWVLDFATGSTARLTFDKAAESLPVWSPDGERVIYHSRRDKPPTVFQKPANASPSDFAPNGRAFLYVVGEGKKEPDLWVSPLEGPGSSAPEGKPFLNTEFSESQGRFSPDSRSIAYMSTVSGRAEVYVRPSADGNTSDQWMISTNGGVQPRWNSDGKELFYIASGSRLHRSGVPSRASGRLVPKSGHRVRYDAKLGRRAKRQEISIRRPRGREPLRTHCCRSELAGGAKSKIDAFYPASLAQQPDELLHWHVCAAQNRPQRTAIQFAMIWDYNLGIRLVAAQNHVASPLASQPKARLLQGLYAVPARDTRKFAHTATSNVSKCSSGTGN